MSILHDDIEISFVSKRIIIFDNIWVVQPFQDLYFLHCEFETIALIIKNGYFDSIYGYFLNGAYTSIQLRNCFIAYTRCPVPDLSFESIIFDIWFLVFRILWVGLLHKYLLLFDKWYKNEWSITIIVIPDTLLCSMT